VTEVAPTLDERALVVAVRAGDEAAFRRLIAEYGPAMLRVARRHVSDHAIAEEVVQEAWLGVLRGLERFEGRSSLKTWVFRILRNTAISRAEREGRTVPFSSLDGDGGDDHAVEESRFQAEGRWAGHWAAPPEAWSPEARLLDGETRGVVERTIAELPRAQAIVISLRDVEGFSPEEVCNVLEISESNQRVLLHRARSRVRAALEDHLGERPGP